MKKAYFFAVMAAVLIAISVTALYHAVSIEDIYYFKGHRLFNKGRYAEAAAFFNKALKIAPSNLPALRECGYAYLWSGKPKEAAGCFMAFLCVDPADYKIKKALADALAWSGQYKEAAYLYRNVILHTNDIEAQKDLAAVYLWMKDYGRAEGAVKEAMRHEPDDVQARVLLGKIYLYTGRGREAEKIFNALLMDLK